MHVHLSMIDALVTFAYVLIVGTLWRIGSFLLRGTAFGEAMGIAY